MTRFLPSCMFPFNYLLSAGVTRDCGRQVASLSDRAPPGAVRSVAVCQNELAIVKRVRAFMETKVAPVITKYWVKDAFPFELLPAVVEFSETELPKSSSAKILKRILRERFGVNQERSVG
jgi:hypothetical protein